MGSYLSKSGPIYDEEIIMNDSEAMRREITTLKEVLKNGYVPIRGNCYISVSDNAVYVGKNIIIDHVQVSTLEDVDIWEFIKHLYLTVDEECQLGDNMSSIEFVDLDADEVEKLVTQIKEKHSAYVGQKSFNEY